MLTRMVAAVWLIGVLVVIPSASADLIIAKSKGKLEVASESNKDLEVKGTSSSGVTSLASDATFNGNSGKLDNWTFTVRRPLEFKGTYQGKGYKDVAKFPSPVTRSTNLSLTTGTAPDITTSTASASWTSTGDNDKTRGADLAVSADVVRANKDSPFNLVTAAVLDPWLIENTGLSPVDFHLLVTLSDVELIANSDTGEFAMASLETFAAFGLGDLPGHNALAVSDPFFEVVRQGDSPYVVSSLSILDVVLTLQPGTTYWLIADLEGAASTTIVPEPTSLQLFAIGFAAILVPKLVRRHRLSRATATKSSSKQCLRTL